MVKFNISIEDKDGNISWREELTKEQVLRVVTKWLPDRGGDYIRDTKYDTEVDHPLTIKIESLDNG